jgi:hypothetical protein
LRCDKNNDEVPFNEKFNTLDKDFPPDLTYYQYDRKGKTAVLETGLEIAEGMTLKAKAKGKLLNDDIIDEHDTIIESEELIALAPEELNDVGDKVRENPANCRGGVSGCRSTPAERQAPASCSPSKTTATQSPAL